MKRLSKFLSIAILLFTDPHQSGDSSEYVPLLLREDDSTMVKSTVRCNKCESIEERLFQLKEEHSHCKQTEKQMKDIIDSTMQLNAQLLEANRRQQTKLYSLSNRVHELEQENTKLKTEIACYRNSTIQKSQIARNAPTIQPSKLSKSMNKTAQCIHWMVTGLCPNGNKCRFKHDISPQQVHKLCGFDSGQRSART